jgi:hypothetical protein
MKMKEILLFKMPVNYLLVNLVALIYQQHCLSLMMIRKHTSPLTNTVVFVAQTVLTQIITCTRLYVYLTLQRCWGFNPSYCPGEGF